MNTLRTNAGRKPGKLRKREALLTEADFHAALNAVRAAEAALLKARPLLRRAMLVTDEHDEDGHMLRMGLMFLEVLGEGPPDERAGAMTPALPEPGSVKQLQMF